MIPPAALAVVRAAVEDAQRAGQTSPEDIARVVEDAITFHGWDLVPAVEDADLPQAA